VAGAAAGGRTSKQEATAITFSTSSLTAPFKAASRAAKEEGRARGKVAGGTADVVVVGFGAGGGEEEEGRGREWSLARRVHVV